MRLRSVRFWIVCFLMVLLPIKGFATGMQINCHQAPVSAASAASQHEGHHATSHKHHSATAAHGHAKVEDATTHTQASVSTADLKCGQCSPCCAPAALPTPITLHIAAAPQAHGLAQPAHTPPPFTTARLERPPRNLV